MTISFIGSETKQSAGTTNLTCNVPGGVTGDDFLLAFCYHDAASGSTGAWGLPSGWTVLEAQNHQTGGRDRDTAIFYRVASSSEAISYVFAHTDSNEQSSVSINAWRGVDPAAPFDVTYSKGSHSLSKTNDPTPAQASITTSTDNALIVILCAQTHDDITTVGFPSGFTSRSELFGGTMDHRQQFVGEFPKATAGTYQPGDWTHSFNNSAGEYTTYTLALKEAATGTQHTLSVDAGDYSNTGIDIKNARAYRISAGPGSSSTTGNQVTLIHGLMDAVLEVDQGGYAQTGNAVQFQRGYRLIANPRGYTSAGQEISLIRTRVFHVGTGGYIQEPIQTPLTRQYALTPDAGVSSSSGTIKLSRNYRMGMDAGENTKIGFDAGLTWDKGVVAQVFTRRPNAKFKLSIGL